MDISKIITLEICVLSPFALGWIVLSVIVGIHKGWDTSIRFSLLGSGLLGIFFVIIAVYIFLPSWIIVLVMLLWASSLWLSTLGYLAMQKLGGKLLLTLQNDEKWSFVIMRGATLIITGLTQILLGIVFIIPSNTMLAFMGSSKFYASGIFLISLGIFSLTKKFLCTQIREKGILYETGSFYRWEAIESFDNGYKVSNLYVTILRYLFSNRYQSFMQKFNEDKLSLKLKKSFLKRNINLKIRSQFIKQVIVYLAQNVNNTEKIPPAPVQ